MKINTILVIGANGQIGSVLTSALQQEYGISSVISSDIIEPNKRAGVFEIIDATDYKALEKIVIKYRITQIYHLAAILSANGEQYPLHAWNVNMNTLLNVLEISRKYNVDKIFFPSSIAVFGDAAPLIDTPQDACLNPATMYGISKASGENIVQYYCTKYNMDIRSLRYPGIIGYQSLPGGGTTDYAVDIYHKAIKNEKYTCFLEKGTTLPMIFMDDAIRATIELMKAPAIKIKVRTSYNIAGISFSPEEITKSIQQYYPNFNPSYKPDFRQKIAISWPKSIDDTRARKDWGWEPHYNLNHITQIMLEKLRANYMVAL